MRRRWSSPDDRHPPCHARADAVGFARAGGVRVGGHGCRRGGHRAACGGRACRPRRRGPAGDWGARPLGPRGRPAPEPASARGGGAGKAGRPLHSPRGSASRGRAAPCGGPPPLNRFRSEIAEQPEVAARLLAQGKHAAAEIAARVRERGPGGFTIAARGSSDHAALYAKYLFGARNRVLVALAAPSLFTHYARPPRLDGQCVIGISQSGESPDVVAVVEEARRQGCLTVAITNAAESRLARASELVLRLQAGPEVSVPASKTYTASVLAMAMVSHALDPEPSFEASLDLISEELTPIPLAVLGQLLAHDVAVARGIDPDQPRTIQKVTRTW